MAKITPNFSDKINFDRFSDFPEWENRIGDILVNKGYLSIENLYKALEIQKKVGGRLGWILISHGFVKRLNFYNALSEKLKIPFVSENIENEIRNLDVNLLNELSPDEVIQIQSIPLYIKNNKLVVLTAYPKNNKITDYLMQKFSKYNIKEIEERVITDKDLTELVKKIYKRSLQAKTMFGLYNRNPQQSAYIRITKPQIFIFVVMFVLFAAFIYFYPNPTLIALFAFIQLFYLLSITFKFIVSIAGVRHKFSKELSNSNTRQINSINKPLSQYPVYTVLIPLFKEPKNVLESIINAIRNLDYPQNKLDVIFLFEEHDTQTLEAAKSLNPPSSWRFFIVPNGIPTTKPKACNYGLYLARGKYLVIYDAEDIPEPDQLKKAVAAFEKGGDEYGCFQAFLNYYNKNENFLTRMFTLEYTYWFDYLLSGLFKLKLPIPLGGTSNHFRVDILKKISGWDPYNVTEDADLGVRMAAENKKVGVIDSTTYEEANSNLANWIRQRSRWIKGYMQTSLVYNRNPIKLIKTLGFIRWASFQLLITGTPFTFLVNPIMWITFILWIFAHKLIIFPDIPQAIVLMGTISLIAGNLIMILLNLAAALSRKYYDLIPYALLNPIYWILHSVAAYKALWQLLFRPYYWEKTNHGISKFKYISYS